MTISEYPIEGCFIITSDQLIFEVKGIHHPQERIIAYVRYVPEKRGQGFRKIYNLKEREAFLKKEYPQYLWFSENHGRILQSVPRHMVSQVLNPIEGLQKMREISEKNSALGHKTLQLADNLVEFTGINWSDIGVTGSQLLGISKDTSDIDLVIYGESICRLFYTRLYDNYDSIPKIKQYSGEHLDQHIQFRWKYLTDSKETLEKIESNKKLQGLFDSTEFFIRLVKFPNESNEEYGHMKTNHVGINEIKCQVTSSRDSIFTPCEYEVKSKEFPGLKRLISYRGRFTEQVTGNTVVRVRGRLEEVIDTRENETFQQIVLGEDPSDYLIPL